MCDRLINTKRAALVAAFVACLQAPVALEAEVVVTTLGGGPIIASGSSYGYVDGDTKQQAQFNAPSGIALDEAGFLYVADRYNGAVRKLDVNANTTSTYIKDLTGKEPVGLAIDRTNVLYVACLGETAILKYDRFNRFTPVASPIGSGLNRPAAIALNFNTDSKLTDIYVVEKGAGTGGALKRIDPVTQASTIILAGLGDPSGVAVLDSGFIIVSETSAHKLLVVDSAKKVVVKKIGSTAGFADGPLDVVQFNQPQHLFLAPNGVVVVADHGNHCVRMLGANARVTTLYGIDPADWGVSYPGWWDGPAGIAECREPVGVCVGTNGTVYASEDYYHIIRQVEGAGLAASGQNQGGGAVTVPDPPILSVTSYDSTGAVVRTTNDLSGYYPMGLDISVSMPSTNLFFNTVVRYTTDGTDPTTNSPQVVMTGNQGVIHWAEHLRDLTSLRVRSFVKETGSAIISGRSTTTNQVGLSRDLYAGVGSTVVVPVVVNLDTNTTLRSLQFRIDVTPTTMSTPVIPAGFDALSVVSDTLIPVTGFTVPGQTSYFSAFTYTQGRTSRMEISFLTSNANFFVKNFGAVAMVAVPVPADAKEGQSYAIDVVDPSGTTDASSGRVNLAALPRRMMLVTNLSYVVGDTSPGVWYNAGGFGKGWLENSDVNNAMYASMGERSPFSFSDIFDAMDAFPMDDLKRGIPGGDGQIRYLDWQTILLRSLGRPEVGEASQYVRSWDSTGRRRARTLPQPVPMSAELPAERLLNVQSNTVWFRNAAFGALPVENATPGAFVDVPVYLNVYAPYTISGMQFRVRVSPQNGAPAIAGPTQFIPAATISAPPHVVNFAPDDASWAWDISHFNPQLKGSNILGSVRFKIPPLAVAGGSYDIHFLNADGAPDINTQYAFETVPAIVWVGTSARRPAAIASDEWKMFFFGSSSSSVSEDDADPDSDGSPNWQEYLSGTNPASLVLRIFGPEWNESLKATVFRLRWFGGTGRSYSLEWNTNLNGGTWNVLTNGAGTGEAQELLETNARSAARFYRLSVVPPGQ